MGPSHTEGARGERHLARQVLRVVLAEGAPLAAAVDAPRPDAAAQGRARVGRCRGGDEAGEPLVGIGEEARLAHLAVGDDVEADLGLLAAPRPLPPRRRVRRAGLRRSSGRRRGRAGASGCSRAAGCCRRASSGCDRCWFSWAVLLPRVRRARRVYGGCCAATIPRRRGEPFSIAMLLLSLSWSGLSRPSIAQRVPGLRVLCASGPRFWGVRSCLDGS